jgi:hypothetical protein
LVKINFFFQLLIGTESSSSWNSSGDEDEDSLSAEVSLKKNTVATPRNSNILKIIDEEKLLNDSKESNKSEFFLSKNEVIINFLFCYTNGNRNSKFNSLLKK